MDTIQLCRTVQDKIIFFVKRILVKAFTCERASLIFIFQIDFCKFLQKLINRHQCHLMSSTFDIQMLKVRDVNDNNFFATSFQTGIRLTYYFYVIFIYYVMKKLILKQKILLLRLVRLQLYVFSITVQYLNAMFMLMVW